LGSRPDTWGRHEELVLEVFEGALLRLEAESELPEKEDELNRKLLFHARRENYRLLKQGRGCRSNIYYECAKQPVREEKSRAASEWKRPDFTCGLVDAQAQSDLFLALECKRLGVPKPRGWVLNENYTTRGVKRFIDADWGYGEGAASGAMMGYVQTMPLDKTLEEVNGYARQVKVPMIRRSDRAWIEYGVTRLNQTLDREVPPSPFRLVHLWVNLRHHYSTETPVSHAGA